MVSEKSKEYKKRQYVLTKFVSRCRARTLSMSKKRNPKKFWQILQDLAKDKGAPHPPKSLLEEYQNDTAGVRVCSGAALGARRIRSLQSKVFSVADNLSPECGEQLNFSLVALHHANKCIMEEFPSMSVDSIVALSASDPLAPMEAVDKRLQLKRDLSACLLAMEVQRSKGISRGEHVRRSFPEACCALEKDLSDEEVGKVLLGLKDVGPGIDGISPILLRALQNDTTSELTRILNLVWSTGVFPSECHFHRCLLLYKGKGTDPHCFNNYRGLAVDHYLLEIMSLVMNNRLETFLIQTNGLSVCQGGFQRQRGCPEQVFCLSETVRAAIKEKEAYLSFIDVQRAYDSCLHPIL